jgi:hypothetical protein
MEPGCKAGELEIVQQQQAKLAGNLQEIISRLQKKNDAIFGSQCGKLQGNVPAACDPPGLIGAIKGQVADLLRKSEEILGLVSKLEDL